MSPCSQSSRGVNSAGRRPVLLLLVIGMVAALALAATNAPSASASWPSIDAQAKKACKKKKGKAKKACIGQKTQQLNRTKGDVSVMTRNLYLGANLGPAINADGLTGFQAATGQIIRNVDANDFPTRAKGLADEIRGKSPDVVGLQEVALWRIGDPTLPKVKPHTPQEDFTVRQVKYDFLNLLMAELNKGKRRYQKVKETIEFDFEGTADYSIGESVVAGGRLTMRDVIIAKVGAGVTWSNTREGNFSTAYKDRVAIVDVTVDRGWNSADFKVRNAPRFRFVNTHLESFGDDKNRVRDCMTDPAEEFASNPVSIRCSQAKELYETIIGPSKLPVIALGDFNSNDQSDWDPNCPSEANVNGTLPGNNGGICGDEFAYRALTTLGMRNIGTSNPLSCCLQGDVMAINGPGNPDHFDHQVDHILTRNSDKVTRLSSSVTGLQPVNGFWNSDHAGVYSKLRIKP